MRNIYCSNGYNEPCYIFVGCGELLLITDLQVKPGRKMCLTDSKTK